VSTRTRQGAPGAGSPEHEAAPLAGTDRPGPAHRPRRMRHRLTDPLLWPAIMIAVAVGAAVIGSLPVSWAALAALAGFALSGSV
jgi:fatty acid desaturase